MAQAQVEALESEKAGERLEMAKQQSEQKMNFQKEMKGLPVVNSDGNEDYDDSILIVELIDAAEEKRQSLLEQITSRENNIVELKNDNNQLGMLVVMVMVTCE